MSHPEFISGHWTGFFNHQAGGRRHATDLVLTFVRGLIAGQGEDEVGAYGIAGCYDADGAELTWTKTYFGGHSIRYRGYSEGAGIWGTWEIPGNSKGGFHIWPGIENVTPAMIRAHKQATGVGGKISR